MPEGHPTGKLACRGADPACLRSTAYLASILSWQPTLMDGQPMYCITPTELVSTFARRTKRNRCVEIVLAGEKDQCLRAVLVPYHLCMSGIIIGDRFPSPDDADPLGRFRGSVQRQECKYCASMISRRCIPCSIGLSSLTPVGAPPPEEDGVPEIMHHGN